MRRLCPVALRTLALALAIASAGPLRAQFQQPQDEQRGIGSPMNPAQGGSTGGQRRSSARSTRGEAQSEPVEPLPEGWQQTVLGPYGRPASFSITSAEFNSRLSSRRSGRGNAPERTPVELRYSLADYKAASAGGQGCRYAVVQRSNRRSMVLLDGAPGREYEFAFDARFSADGKHFVYAVNEGSLGRLIIDGAPGLPGPEIVPATLQLSPDGSRAAYAVMNGEKMQVVCDGKPGRDYDEIKADGIRFSDDGTRFAYIARTGERWAAVTDDGKQSQNFDEVSGLTLSADGSRVAFIGSSGNLTVAVVDGKPGVSFGDIRHLAFTPDGKHTSYIGVRDDKMCIIWNLAATPMADEILPPGLILSPNGQKKIYAARFGNKWRIMDGAKAGPDYDAIGRGSYAEPRPSYLPPRQPGPPRHAPIAPVVFSPDGTRMAYGVRRGDRYWMQLGDSPLPDFSSVRNPVFSPDGKRFAYIARQGETEVVMLDGLPSKEYQRIATGSLMFSPDGSRLSCVTEERDGVRVVVNEVAGPKLTSLAAGPVWRDDGTLEFLAPTTPVPDEGMQLTRFTVPPPK